MTRTPNIDLRENYGRNYIINGNFDFWQRGTSFNNTDSEYLADRFFYGSDYINVNLARSTDVPSDTTAQYSHLIERTVAAGAPTATQVTYLRYVMEGNNYVDLHDRQVNISFWVKNSIAGDYTLNLTSGDFGRRYLTRYTINQANTWEQKTVTVQMDNQGVWNFDQNSGLQIFWVLSSGSSYETSDEDTWVASSGASNWSLPGQVQFAENGAQTFRVAQIQVTLGAETLPFRRAGATIDLERSLCERYFQKTWALDDAVGFNTTTGRRVFGTFQNGASDIGETTVEFRQAMRVAPTTTLYSSNGLTKDVIGYTTRTNSSSVHPNYSIVRTTQTAFNIEVTGVSGGARGDSAQLLFHYTLEADF